MFLYLLLVRILSNFPKVLLGVAEQGLHSVFSFTVVAISSRVLTQTEFGAFALFWGLYPIILLFHSALLSRPLSIIYPTVDDNEKCFFINFFNFLDKGFCMVAGATLLSAILLFYLDTSKDFIFALCGLGIMALRVEVESVRRVYIIRNDHIHALLRTFVVLFPGIAILCIGYVFYNDLLLYSELSSFTIIVLVVFAIPCACLFPFKDKVNQLNTKAVLGSLNKYSKSLFLAATIEVFFKRLSPYLMVVGAGIAEAAVWAAARAVIGPVQMILVGIMGSALPDMRAAYVESGDRSLKRKAKKYFTILVFSYFSPLVLIAIFSSQMLELLIGVEYPGTSTTLDVYCATFFIMGVNSFASIYLQAIGFVKQQIYFTSITSVTYFFGTFYIFYQGVGAVGVALLSLASEVIGLIVYLYYLSFLIDRRDFSFGK